MAELPERLRAAADAHRPDRERMLARVERGMDPPGGADEPGRTVATSHGATVAPPPAVSGTSGAATAHPRAGTSAPSRSPTGLPRSSHGPSAGTTTSPAGPAAGSGYVPGTTGAGSPPPPSAQSGTGMTATGTVDAGSNSYWAQSDITVSVSRPLTSLTVELRVVDTGGVASTGQWSTANGQDLTTSSGTEGGDLVYRWVLDTGRTLQPGTYTFAGQFSHDPGNRDASGDHYAVTGDGPGGPVAAGGGF